MTGVNKSLIFVDDSELRESDQYFTFPSSPNRECRGCTGLVKHCYHNSCGPLAGYAPVQAKVKSF